MAMKSSGRKRNDPGRAYDMDLEIVEVFLQRWPRLQRKARKYLDDRRALLKGKPDRRGHWMEEDKHVPAADEESERLRRMIRNRLRHLLKNAKDHREISMSVAAGALGVNENRVRKLWPATFNKSRRADSRTAGKSRRARSVVTVAQLKALREKMKELGKENLAKSVNASFPATTTAAPPRRLPLSPTTGQGSFLKAAKGSISFDLSLEGSAEALEDFLNGALPMLINAVKSEVLANFTITGLDDSVLTKYLQEGAELQYMTLAQSLSMPWAHVEEQERWTELYVALLDARSALAQKQRAQVEAALFEARLPPPGPETKGPRRIGPNRL